MTTLIAVCVVLLTLIHLAGLVLLIYTLVQLQRSAQAVEVLAYSAQEQVTRLHDTAKRVHDFAGTVRSGWARLLTVALSAAVTMWHRDKDATDQSEKKTD